MDSNGEKSGRFPVSRFTLKVLDKTIPQYRRGSIKASAASATLLSLINGFVSPPLAAYAKRYESLVSLARASLAGSAFPDSTALATRCA